MQKLALVIVVGALALVTVAANSPAAAQSASVRSGQGVGPAPMSDASGQVRRRRTPTQLRVYRDRAYLPPNAVRTCDSWLEQEFRPSGTVIVPRMRCRWVAG